jgi:septal ring-binding cell division protein DamX
MNMTTDERKRSYSAKRSNGWLATLGGAALLVAVGFGVGLVAGTAYEEPELVAEHLSGRTTEVVLGPIGDGLPEEGSLDAPADVAAAPPLADTVAASEVEPLPTPLGAGGLDAEPEAQRAPPAAPARAKPAAKPTAAGGFSIQVGAFGTEATARQLAGELGQRGYKTYVISEGGDASFKVRVGPIASRAEAERLSERLKSEHRLPTWILTSGKS